MTDWLALPRRYRDQLEALLRKHVPGVEVWAYGSRVNGESHDGSDLDLALRGPALEPLDGGFYDLLEAIEKSNIPILVQAHDWAMLPESFRREIERGYVVLQEGAKQTAASSWHEVRLGDVMSFANGRSSPERSGDSLYPVYGSNGIIGKSNEMNADANTIVIGRVGSYCGSLHFSNENCWITDNAIRAKAVGENDSKFFFFLLQSLGLNEWRSGSGQPLLNQTILSSIPTVIPSLSEQRAIAHVLGTLDDKIELNRRMNETLEAMARALFKSWFVDFEPVRAKMEGRLSAGQAGWRRGESLPGLTSEHYDLFPDQLVDSGLGEVPEGWAVKMLGDICHKPQYGYTASASDEDVGPKFLRITDINKKAWIEWQAVPHCEISDANQSKYRLRHGDILIARMADPGHGCMVEEDRDAVFASYLIRFRPVHERYARLLQYWLRSDAYWELVIGRGAGTTRVSLNAKVLSEFPLVVPPTPLLDAFGAQVGSLRTRLVANAEESRILTAQRDTLLPGLVSGEVGVSPCS